MLGDAYVLQLLRFVTSTLCAATFSKQLRLVTFTLRDATFCSSTVSMT